MVGQGRNPGYRLGQLGFLSQRTWGIVLVLSILLIVPYWIVKKTGGAPPVQTAPGSGKQTTPSAGAGAGAGAASAASGTTPSVTSAKAATAPAELPTSAAPTASPDRFGLSFGHGELPSKHKDLMYSACAGAPLDMGNPDKGQCNPSQGDSSCRTALPVLCILQDASTPESAGLVNEPKSEGMPKAEGVSKVEGASKAEGTPKPENTPKGPDFYAAWVGGTLAATAPVAGFVLGSLAQANARCASELGTGWRMAELRDAGTGVGLVGKRGQGLVSTHTRHWVAAKEHKSHCWDPS